MCQGRGLLGLRARKVPREPRERRVRLARSAHGVIAKGLAGDAYPVADLKTDLDLFCLELAERFHDRFEVVHTGARRTAGGKRFALRPYVINGGGSPINAAAPSCLPRPARASRG